MNDHKTREDRMGKDTNPYIWLALAFAIVIIIWAGEISGWTDRLIQGESQYDVNRDGLVDITDLSVLASYISHK